MALAAARSSRPAKDAPQQRPHTHPDAGIASRPRLLRRVGGSARVWGAEGGERAASLPASNADCGVFCSPLGASAFFLSQPQIAGKSKGKRARSRAESFAELRCSGRAGLACARGSARASGQRGRAATVLRSWRLNEWELQGARPLRSASPSSNFSSSCCCRRRRGCCCDRLRFVFCTFISRGPLKKREREREREGPPHLALKGLRKHSPFLKLPKT